MNLFYAGPKAIQGDSIIIEGQESIHIAKVLRYAVGDEVYVTDGKGYRYRCKIGSVSKKTVTLDIQERSFFEPSTFPVSVAIGLIKKRDRLEFAVEKITELGADEIIIFAGDHSEKSSLRIDRIESAVLSAMKQSLRYWLPEVRFFKSAEKLLEETHGADAIIIGDETEEKNTLESLKKRIPDGGRALLVIGPEGGFSQNERTLFKKFNAYRCSLGVHRLRTETAAIVMTDRYKN